MKLDKKQIPQLVLLGIMLIGCIGFISFQLKSSAITPPPAKPATSAVVEIAPVAPNEAVALMAGMVFPNLSMQVPRRDPFAPMSKNLLQQDQTAPKPVVTAHSKPPRFNRPNPFSNMNNAVPPLTISPIGTNRTAAADSAAEPEKDPDFTLTGIIRGVENVAIIRSGQGRYVVKQGALIEGRYRVISISQDSIMLDNQGRLLRVKLGGVKNAS